MFSKLYPIKKKHTSVGFGNTLTGKNVTKVTLTYEKIACFFNFVKGYQSLNSIEG